MYVCVEKSYCGLLDEDSVYEAKGRRFVSQSVFHPIFLKKTQACSVLVNHSHCASKLDYVLVNYSHCASKLDYVLVNYSHCASKLCSMC